MLYLAMILTVGGAVALDQLTKYLTIQNIPLGGYMEAIPGLFHLTYIRNTGAAFGMLEGGRTLFLIITVLALAAAVQSVRKKWIDHPLGLWAVALICGGAVGNLIDRFLYGSVVDMIELDFMNFAIFNVADCFISIGAVLLIIWALFFDRKKEKKEPSDESPA